MLFFLGSFIFMFTNFPAMAGKSEGMPTMFKVIFPLHIFTMLEMFALLIVYVLRALKNERLDQNTRLLWAILLFVGNMLAFPIYYCLHILRPRDSAV